jgi:hypothetical protein
MSYEPALLILEELNPATSMYRTATIQAGQNGDNDKFVNGLYQAFIKRRTPTVMTIPFVTYCFVVM